MVPKSVEYRLLNECGVESAPVADWALALRIRNAGEILIVAYSLYAKWTDAAGAEKRRVQIFRDFEGKGNQTAIAPGAARVVSLDGVVVAEPVGAGRSRAGVRIERPDREIEEMPESETVVLSLDLVVFGDGRSIGPNEGDGLSLVEAEYEAERDAARILRSQLKANRSSEVIKAWLDREISVPNCYTGPRDERYGGHYTVFRKLTCHRMGASLKRADTDAFALLEMIEARPELRFRR